MFSYITSPIEFLLTFLYHFTGDNLGLAIIFLTLIVRGVLVPITLPSLKSIKKMQELKPTIDKLKAKHGSDNQQFQLAQLELYKQHGVNPLSGCLPQIAQLVVLIALYQVFLKFISHPEIDGGVLNFNFLWLDLAKKDPYYVLPILAGVSQMVFSLMMTTGTEKHIENPKNKTEKKKEEDSLEMAQSMQQQMLFMMPIMTTIISLNFASGLTLYWVITTIFSIGQQYIISGLGGLKNVPLQINSLLGRFRPA